MKENLNEFISYCFNLDDPYENLSNEELKEIFEDMQADYWIDYYQSICE